MQPGKNVRVCDRVWFADFHVLGEVFMLHLLLMELRLGLTAHLRHGGAAAAGKGEEQQEEELKLC